MTEVGGAGVTGKGGWRGVLRTGVGGLVWGFAA